MALPAPRPGLVIRYDYLWSEQAARGVDHGKDRPACLIAASDPGPSPRFVVLLPITHSPPSASDVGVAIPPPVGQALGLDDQPSWVMVSEHNVDAWPNAGLQPLPGQPGVFAYGHVPPALFAMIKTAFLTLARSGAGHGVRR